MFQDDNSSDDVTLIAVALDLQFKAKKAVRFDYQSVFLKNCLQDSVTVSYRSELFGFLNTKECLHLSLK